MEVKRFWAMGIKQILLGLAVVFLLGGLVTYTSDDPNFLLGGAIAVGVYLFASAALSLLDLVRKALYLWLFAGDDMVDLCLNDLRKARLPPPGPSQPRNYDYLQMLADDDDALPEARVRAAVLFGAYNQAMGTGIFRALALRKALDKAVLRYADEAPMRH